MKVKYGSGSAVWAAQEKQRADDRRRRNFLSQGGKLPDHSGYQMQRDHFYAYANRCAFARGSRLTSVPR